MGSFVWDLREPRMKSALLQRKKEDEGIALPNNIHCYQAALLETLAQWWNPLTKYCWDFEPVSYCAVVILMGIESEFFLETGFF